ncbi:class I glutamine amidotransferase-like protein [Xylaria bambusicola]|uniref:class I glutamine amidotransferase-like protein n=1 Tax=Xylaria bambusicola TaxID=326684 RepID=UPI0020076C22|nr:class I glutamine amidotransferase-like protein [Xylaria bambusicola]KAI0512459.1 class I glutamine amidotransferase-like protein [Xylaria bambusicola]
MSTIFTDVNKVSKAPDNRPVVRIGVFIPTDAQVLDTAGVDIFGSLSYEYFSLLSHMLPQVVIDSAPSVQILYVGSVAAGERIPLTSNQSVVASHHYSEPEVAPGKLNIIYVPGTDPDTAFPEGASDWLARQGATEGVDILSVCTGIFTCGAAGLLKGKSICGPRSMQDRIKAKNFGQKSLRGSELRWIQDGNFWSCGAVTSGNELVAAYCRAHAELWPRPLVELVCEELEVGDKPQEYNREPGMEKYVGELLAAAGQVSG